MTTRAHTIPCIVSVVLASLQTAAPSTVGQTDSHAQAKQQFVTSLTHFIGALAGTYGDEGPMVRTSLDEMRQALARWDRSVAEYEMAVAAQIRGADRRRAAGLRRILVLLYLDRGRAGDAFRELTAATILDPSRADVWFLQGMVASRLNRPTAATGALIESSRRDPDNPVTFYVLANELRKIEKLEEAEEARQTFVDLRRPSLEEPPPARPAPPFLQWDLLRASADATPFFAPARYAEGFALLKQGRYDEALDRFEDAAATDPLVANATTSSARMVQGSAAFRQGQLTAAAGHLEAVVAIAPDDGDAHRILGTIYGADGRRADGVAQLEAAIRLDPDDERARLALADVLVEDGRVAKAERTLQDTIRAIPASGHAHYRLGQVSRRLKKYAEALGAFDEAVRLAPVVGVDRIYREVAELPNSVEPGFDRAIARSVARVELDPNNPEAHVAMGAAYLQSNRSDDAIAELLAALMIDPRRTSAAAALGQAYLRTGDYAGAAAAARRAVTGDPTLAEARYTLATSLARLGRADEAKQEFARYQGMLAEAQANRRRDFELAKLMRDVRDSVGRGDLDDAIARLRDAILIKPDDGALHVSLGLFLRESGRLPEAAASLEQALALNADPGLHRHLAEIYADLGRPEDAARHRAVVDGGRADAR